MGDDCTLQPFLVCGLESTCSHIISTLLDVNVCGNIPHSTGS